MILKALYDYYNRCGNLPAPGMEEKEIGFVIVKANSFALRTVERTRPSEESILSKNT